MKSRAARPARPVVLRSLESVLAVVWAMLAGVAAESLFSLAWWLPLASSLLALLAIGAQWLIMAQAPRRLRYRAGRSRPKSAGALPRGVKPLDRDLAAASSIVQYPGAVGHLSVGEDVLTTSVPMAHTMHG